MRDFTGCGCKTSFSLLNANAALAQGVIRKAAEDVARGRAGSLQPFSYAV